MQNEVELNEKDRQSLVQKVANLMGTGEDNTSYKKVITKLNKKQLEEIGTEKSHDRPINVLQREIEELSSEIFKIENFSSIKYDLQERKKDILDEIDKRQIKLEALKEIKALKDEIDLDFLRDDINDLIKSCIEGTERTKNIVLDLKNFSRMEEMVLTQFDIPKEIDTTLNILNNKYKNISYCYNF